MRGFDLPADRPDPRRRPRHNSPAGNRSAVHARISGHRDEKPGQGAKTRLLRIYAQRNQRIRKEENQIDERDITFTEADGGMWRLEARKTVAAYLKDALADEIENGNVKVML